MSDDRDGGNVLIHGNIGKQKKICFYTQLSICPITWKYW